MLSSQALTLSKTSVTPGSLRALPTVLARSGGLPRRPRPYQQVRAFRIGLWSSYLDANFQKEFRRRQRMVKHKYIEALNRKLSWDRHLPMHLRHLRHSGLKSFMCSAWRGQDSRPGGRWVNSEDLEYMNERNTEKKERGIEDVEQNALNHLLDNHHKFIRAKARIFGPGWSTCHSTSWVSRPAQDSNTPPTNDMSDSSTVYGSEGFRKRFHVRDYQEEEQTEYEIDPITNRKVQKEPSQPTSDRSTSTDIPVKTFKGYRSQFKTFEPPNAPPRDTTPRSVSKQTTAQHRSSQPYSPSSHQPESFTTRPHDKEVDHLAKYDEKVGFMSGRQYDTAEMDIDYSHQQGLKRYDEKLSKKTPTNATTENTSPGQKHAQDGLEAYDEKVKNQVRQFFASPHEEIEQADPVKQAIDRYNSFKELDASRVVYPNKTNTEDKILEAKRDYEHSASRKAFMREQQADKLLKSIQNYEEIMSAERLKGHVMGPMGHQHLHPLLKAIREYEASMADKRTNPREAAANDRTDPLLRAIREYKGLVSRTGESNPATTKHLEMEAVDPLLSSIDEYEESVLQSGAQSSSHASTDECLKSYDAKVNYYQGPQTEDSSRRVWFSTRLDPAKAHSEALKDQTKARSSSVDETSTPKSWAHLPQRIRDLFAREAKSEAEVLDRAKDDVTEDISRLNALRTASDVQEPGEAEEEKTARRKALEHDFETAHMAEADANLSAERLRERTMLLKSDLDEARNVEVVKELKPTGTPKKMTGNFVRDFPEEFQTAWTASEESSGGLTRKIPSDQEVESSVQGSEQAYIIGLGAKEAFSRNPDVERIEPSLDRTVSRNSKSIAAEKDRSHVGVGPAEQGEGDISASVSAYVTPKDNETMNMDAHTTKAQLQKEKNAQKELDRELVREVRRIYEDSYGTIDSKHRQVPSPAKGESSVSKEAAALEGATETPEPAMYKILAYDPTMQSISSAETTSVVPDSSGPLTPAEVLLRLSNPAKFFPHFEPLRSQGYEIVSGSGDVLVFRKVREASPMKPEKEYSAAAKEDQSSLEHRKNVMNPIDGMTRGPIAATGDFASPTGFVNHDIPRGSEPPFKSNIDVRREEPVFSGKRNWEDNEGGRKKRGAAKTVLIGAGWLAACSYAIGVVSEYFKTGGVDGQGPKGF
ncbi:uncharacterized protein LY89DRAFT_63392 [Mollisia scopiformis]|uniref:Uncharacterized protein n=1 Tax=Mollisia scopiformis TaxID=149040 RepID=A0A194X9C6_MOLSC|nr:uncharacterized protein LY89DRAFT_63392 [Mollisia scopiformis]KUJ16724.1 hypothetical protein LY89DRAFT_63392 [Mollisia scopiformis]